MAIDYRENPHVSLSAADYERYALVNARLMDLRVIGDRARPTAAERAVLAPFFWHYLHEPCKALDIPVDCAVAYLDRFFKFLDHHGKYKGSIYGVLQAVGLPVLASKIHLDRTVLIPRLISDLDTPRAMDKRAKTLSKLYFDRIDGIDGSTGSTDDAVYKWRSRETVSYQLNEGGRAYDAARTHAIGDADRLSRLSLSHWAGQVNECSQQMPGRARASDDLQSSGDTKSTGKQPDARELHKSVNPVKKRLRGWMVRSSQVTLPDFFENRPCKGFSEA